MAFLLAASSADFDADQRLPYIDARSRDGDIQLITGLVYFDVHVPFPSHLVPLLHDKRQRPHVRRANVAGVIGAHHPGSGAGHRILHRSRIR
jgi:hypothetical protein